MLETTTFLMLMLPTTTDNNMADIYASSNTTVICKTSTPIEAWKCNLLPLKEIMTDRPTDPHRQTDRRGNI